MTSEAQNWLEFWGWLPLDLRKKASPRRLRRKWQKLRKKIEHVIFFVPKSDNFLIFLSKKQKKSYFSKKNPKKIHFYLDMKAEEWSELKYYKTDLCSKLLKECPNQVDRVHYKDLTVEMFVSKYEKPNKPVIIHGLAETCFPIKKYWTFEVFSIYLINFYIIIIETMKTLLKFFLIL